MNRANGALVCNNTDLKLVRYVTRTMGAGNKRVVNMIPTGLRRGKGIDALPSHVVRARGLDSHGSVVMRRSSVLLTLPKNMNALSRVFRIVTTTSVNCRRGGIIFCGIGNFCSALLTTLGRVRDGKFTHRPFSACCSVTGAPRRLGRVVAV